jgi:superoxide dismutase, Fe-Mn family
MDLRSAVELVESAGAIEAIQLSKLNYPLDALEPVMSKKCVDVHYNTLTKNYFKKYQETGDLFQKAGAVLHNDYYWPSMQPYQSSNPVPKSVTTAIEKSHGTLNEFKQKVLQAGSSIQGNGWVLIMKDLQITTVSNHVIKNGIAWAIDLWEHATVDHNFNREKFFKGYWNIVNWSFVEQSIA